MWMKWFQTASRNPYLIKITSDWCFSCIHWTCLERSSSELPKGLGKSILFLGDIYIKRGDFYVSWISWDIGEKEELVWFLFRNSWWLEFSGDAFSEGKWISHFHATLLTWSLCGLLTSIWGLCRGRNFRIIGWAEQPSSTSLHAGRLSLWYLWVHSVY